MKRIFTFLLALILLSSTTGQTNIKLTKYHGLYLVPCQINGKITSLIFDPGASEVSLSKDYFNQSLIDGNLKSSDLISGIEGESKYKVADGSVHIGRRINIREIRIGDLILTNIIGSITESKDAPLLLGQTALKQFGTYKINNSIPSLIITGNAKSDIDFALKESNQKRMSPGNIERNNIIKHQIKQAKVEILADRKIAQGLEFEVSKISFNKEDDGEITFSYDITNNSGLDYKTKALSQLYIFIDVFTDDGKIYSSSIQSDDMLAGNTVNGQDFILKLRNKKPKYFRLYGVVNSPLLSSIEN